MPESCIRIVLNLNKEKSIKVTNKSASNMWSDFRYSLINWLLWRNAGASEQWSDFSAQHKQNLPSPRVIFQEYRTDLTTSSNNTIHWKSNQLTMTRMADTTLAMIVRRRCASSWGALWRCDFLSSRIALKTATLPVSHLVHWTSYRIRVWVYDSNSQLVIS